MSVCIYPDVIVILSTLLGSVHSVGTQPVAQDLVLCHHILGCEEPRGTYTLATPTYEVDISYLVGSVTMR